MRSGQSNHPHHQTSDVDRTVLAEHKISPGISSQLPASPSSSLPVPTYTTSSTCFPHILAPQMSVPPYITQPALFPRIMQCPDPLRAKFASSCSPSPTCSQASTH